MDKIIIEGLQLKSLIGVYDWERTAKTRLLLDVVLYTDLQLAGLSDDVNDTVNYAAVAELLVNLADASEFELLEALAHAMVNALFEHFSLLKVRVKLSKPDILTNADNVAVEITREEKC